jgi:cysteine-rich repeat protein
VPDNDREVLWTNKDWADGVTLDSGGVPGLDGSELGGTEEWEDGVGSGCGEPSVSGCDLPGSPISGCGNGVLEPELAEECDDANQIDWDGCSSACGVSKCLLDAFDGGDQRSPRVAYVGNEQFMVVWSSCPQQPGIGDGQDGDGCGVFGKFYAVGATCGGSQGIQVNSQIVGNQTHPEVTGFASGGSGVVWEDMGLGGLLGCCSGVVMQRFAVDGEKLGKEELVSWVPLAYQVAPSIAAFSDGSYAVVWTSISDAVYEGFGPAYCGSNIMGKLFLPDSTVFSHEWSGGTFVATLDQPIVSGVDPLVFLVTWTASACGSDGTGQDKYGDGKSSGIGGQFFTSTWSPLGGAFGVNAFVEGPQLGAGSVVLTDGRFVVVWNSKEQDEEGWGVFGRLVNPGEVEPGSDFQVNAEGVGAQVRPSVTALTGGGFAVTWVSLLDDGNQSLSVRLFDANGLPKTGDIEVDSSFENATKFGAPDIAGAPDGTLLVVWDSLVDNDVTWRIFGQLLDETGKKLWVVP